MKTIAKLMALWLFLGAWGFAQGTNTDDSKKSDHPEVKTSSTAGKNSKTTSAAKNTSVGKNSAGATTGTHGKKPLLTKGDCEALGGEVSASSTCASGNVCTTKIYDPNKLKGYDVKTRCFSAM
jgi:hypothetical protein